VVGYSPFGHGRFPRAGSPGRRALDEIAARHGVTARQVALAFLTRAAPLFTIPKASSAAHAEENAGALSLQLAADDVAALNAAFPVETDGSLPMI
jgi:diketogulonate reductase-like aldo/keto reductase